MPKPPHIPSSEIADLIQIARQHGLSKIRVQQGDARVEIRLAVAGEGTMALGPSYANSQAEPPELDPEVVHILSPMTGVIYLAPSPNDPPFVHPGDIVREGDPIGLIEAMKVFSEVLSDQTGRVRHVLTVNGQLVQQGEPLLELTALETIETE